MRVSAPLDDDEQTEQRRRRRNVVGPSVMTPSTAPSDFSSPMVYLSLNSHLRNYVVDAFSLLLRDRPLIVLVKDKADAARSNFDAAHELGHLLLHHDAEPANVVREHEANAFASAFLMPATAMLRELPGRVDWQALLALKRRWHVSLQALLYRARTLGRISESAYKRAMVRLSAAGWRTREPGDLGDPEAPTLIAKAVSLLEEAGLLERIDLARRVRITEDMLEDFIPAPAPRPRVVVS